MGSADLQTRHKGLQVEVRAQRRNSDCVVEDLVKTFYSKNYFVPSWLTHLGANYAQCIKINARWNDRFITEETVPPRLRCFRIKRQFLSPGLMLHSNPVSPKYSQYPAHFTGIHAARAWQGGEGTVSGCEKKAAAQIVLPCVIFSHLHDRLGGTCVQFCHTSWFELCPHPNPAHR